MKAEFNTDIIITLNYEHKGPTVIQDSCGRFQVTQKKIYKDFASRKTCLIQTCIERDSIDFG